MAKNLGRRDFLKAAFACGCGFCLPGESPAQNQRRPRIYCDSAPENPASLVDMENAKKKLIALKDSPRLELIRYIQDEDKRLTEFFGTNASIYLDTANNDNAYVNIDQSFIALGEGYIEMHANKKMVRVAGLLAHEQSHIFQIRWTIDELLKAVRNYPVKFVELHADYLAGAYIKWRNPNASFSALSEMFFELGDWNVRGKNHHGTPKERQLAFFQGSDDFPRLRGANGSQPAMAASHRGLMYVKANLG